MFKTEKKEEKKPSEEVQKRVSWEMAIRCWHLKLIDGRFVALGHCVSQHFFLPFFDIETTPCTRPALRNHLFHISHPHFRFSRAWFSIERAINRCQEVNRLYYYAFADREWLKRAKSLAWSKQMRQFCGISLARPWIAHIRVWTSQVIDYCWSTRADMHPTVFFYYCETFSYGRPCHLICDQPPAMQKNGSSLMM